MSFANYDYEAQPPLLSNKSEPAASSSEHGLDCAIQKISAQLENYGMLISEFKNQTKIIGGRRDGAAFRNKTDALQQEIVMLGNAIKALISRINVAMTQSSTSTGKFAVSNRQLMMKDRLVSDYNGLNGDFQTSVRLYQERKRAYVPKAEPTSLEERVPLMSQQQQQLQQHQLQKQMTEDDIQQTELQYHMLLTEERNRQIDEVAQGIREVNSIFKDLGELVSKQGEQLDTVEENIMQMLGHTQQAARELDKAHEYQKRRSKWSCIFLVALCMVVMIIVLAVVS